jgi:5-methyltetrahydropteroyltriglutamate--homocysteine methyltransferase
MKRSEHRILTTHVGSLVRPKSLVDAIQAGKGDGYDEVLAEATRDIVRQQAAVGIDIVSDGEFGKGSWAQYLLDRVTGFEHRPNELRQVEWLGRDRERYAEFLMESFPGAAKGRPTDACVSEVKYKSLDAIEAVIANFKNALSSLRTTGAKVEEAFLTAVAPASSAYDGINEFYKNERDYVYALADALRQEYQAVYKSGLLLQVDDAVLANMYDTLVQKDPANYRRWAELRIEALNHALEGIPEDRVRYHICFGSWHVPHTADANLSDIIDLILKVNAGAYAIESANPRHEHEWRVWQSVKMPKERILIPGVITHHTVTVEHPRVVADRIVRFAKILGRENVIAGADCGFAQIETIARVHPSIMWAKLESLVEGARIASKELWN